jgi:hypothetical protein
MGAPFFRQLSKAEFEKLSLDERIKYTRELIQHVRFRVEETRRQMQARNNKPRPQ